MDYQQENKQLKQKIQELEAALQAAQQQIAELTALLKQNSRNSHWPSSRDKSRKKKRTKSLGRKSDKKPGGQKGHQGHTLKMSDTPDVVTVHRPRTCQHCQQPFSNAQGAVAMNKRQVHDLPPLQIVVTEHQAETLCCRHCRQLSQGTFPPDVVAPVQYGPGIQQLAIYLKNEQYIPYDRSRQFLADLFDLHLSPGTLQNIVARAAKRLVLGVSVSLGEHEVHWRTFLQSLVQRGQFYLQQNAQAYVPQHSLKAEVAADIRAVFNAANRIEAEALLAKLVTKYEKSAARLASWMETNILEGLTVFDFPTAHHRRIRTTNGLERLNREVRHRSRVATLFPNEASCLRLVTAVLTAVLMEISDEWETGRTYLRLDG